MNDCKFTGWVPREADLRTPPSGPVLYFQVVVPDANGKDELLHFHVTDRALIERCAPLLTKGRPVIVAHSKVVRAWHPLSGYGSSSIFGFHVTELEIPDRSNPKRETTEKREEAPTSA